MVEVDIEKNEWRLGHSCDKDDANNQRREASPLLCMRTLFYHEEHTGCFVGIGWVFEKVLSSETRGPILRKQR